MVDDDEPRCGQTRMHPVEGRLSSCSLAPQHASRWHYAREFPRMVWPSMGGCGAWKRSDTAGGPLVVYCGVLQSPGACTTSHEGMIGIMPVRWRGNGD